MLLFSLLVYARDGAFPARYDVASVVVYVQDANDHNPTFLLDYYVLSVPENEVSSLVHIVVAEDKDIGDNSQLSYSIVGKSIRLNAAYWFRFSPFHGLWKLWCFISSVGSTPGHDTCVCEQDASLQLLLFTHGYINGYVQG